MSKNKFWSLMETFAGMSEEDMIGYKDYNDPRLQPEDPKWEWPEPGDKLWGEVFPGIDFDAMSDEEYDAFLDDDANQQQFKDYHMLDSEESMMRGRDMGEATHDLEAPKKYVPAKEPGEEDYVGPREEDDI